MSAARIVHVPLIPVQERGPAFHAEGPSDEVPKHESGGVAVAAVLMGRAREILVELDPRRPQLGEHRFHQAEDRALAGEELVDVPD